MALMSCLECNNQVSSTAAACPNCGAPVAEYAGSKAAGAPLTTIQETSKRLKLQILAASILVWVGFFGWIAGVNEPKGTGGPHAGFTILFIVGSIWYVATKLRIWWHHK